MVFVTKQSQCSIQSSLWHVHGPKGVSKDVATSASPSVMSDAVWAIYAYCKEIERPGAKGISY